MIRSLPRTGLVAAALLGVCAQAAPEVPAAAFAKPVTLVKLQGDDHGLSKAPTRLKALEAVGAFLHQYLN